MTALMWWLLWLVIFLVRLARGSCYLSCTFLVLWVVSRSRLILWCSFLIVFCLNYWNGVCGLGTKLLIEVVIDVWFVCLRLMVVASRVSLAMPSVLVLVLVGSLMRKYSFMRV